ncbi:uncharacterized protein Z520_08757 [Fonsecaea multimorphosa CBS 102226]|uniref:DNA replication regulator Sld3 C-terminal domain-containing protein n=1 Tax=Fonsecaea multimorphosa CBS 102226 TaxID=1442371 RepID=A0A0D2JQK7_9EURO|nr:uncharacterized protein Z520_08757 [Fonsecaea multimorphosa CBS 102226]KIX95637.1 hypothetical protein Z520_08757 [Fonsecaea multimorphosa CBS 102226]OAL21240.1 hypothetical protein AYO22_08203 [Fonsecaea multimorphosa]
MQSPSLLDLQRPILVPTGDSSLNVAFDSSNLIHSRKRKSSEIEPGNHGLQSDVFAAKLLSPKQTVLNFAPVTLVARACLPLAWLDTSAGTSRTIFEATILSVEEWEQRILLVRQVPNGGLHAVERIGQDVYIACPLHSSISEAWCYDAAIGKVAEVKVEDLLRAEGDDGLRNSHTRTGSVSSLPALSTPKSPKKPTNRRGALARMSILKPKDRASHGFMIPPNSPHLSQQPTAAYLDDLAGQDMAQIPIPDPVMQSPAIPPSSLLGAPTTVTTSSGIGFQDPFDNTVPLNGALLPAPASLAASENLWAGPGPTGPERLRTQYFEHLYTSKTSLAFYVKGPLSRARAHVRSGGDPAKAILELSEFYEQSILPTKKIDLKYKESLSKVIRELPPMIVEQEGEGFVGQDTSQKKKKSRKKKVKLGKDCLWPDEEEFIAKWWRGRDLKATSLTATGQAEEMRKEFADLRMRESEMQMLLILEVMLLGLAGSRLSETAKPAQVTDPEVKLQSVEDENNEILATVPQVPPKEKKRRNWSSEMDTIVDRLCIWHTVSLDDFPATEDGGRKDGSSSTSSKPNEPLKDFCKDVLLPFYSTKLPEQVKSICRKLGGPEISPKRSKQLHPAPAMTLHRSSSISSLTRSKSARPLAKRTLERVLSEDHQLHRHTSPPTTFSRGPSATASVTHNPIIPALKREPSERPVSRGGNLSKSVSFSNREIDLAADQKAHEQKRRKLDRLAQQKRELEAAIDALKKPDRKTAAGLFMDEVEDRKSKEKERKSAVQISATPRARRVKESLMEPELPQLPKLKIQERDAGMVIPSSTIKARPLRSGIPSSNSTTRSSATKRAVLAAIHETPSRGVVKKTSNPLDLPPVCPPLAKEVDQFTIAATPASKQVNMGREGEPLSEHDPPSGSPAQAGPYEEINSVQNLHMTRSRRPVLFTPVKRSDVPLDHVFRDAPEIPEQAGRMMDRVMGGRGRGMMMDDSFQWSQSTTDGVTKTPARGTVEPKDFPMGNVEEDDIYDKLGWNDDFDL